MSLPIHFPKLNLYTFSFLFFFWGVWGESVQTGVLFATLAILEFIQFVDQTGLCHPSTGRKGVCHHRQVCVLSLPKLIRQ